MGARLAGRSRGRRDRTVMSDINVTPLVDVMLVLLVVFMITAPLLTAGVAVDLPKVKSKAISQQDNKPLEIGLDAQGNIFLGDSAITLDKLIAKLEAIAIEAPDRRIYIKADQNLGYGQVMAVMAAVNRAGFTKIALVTDPVAAQK